MLAWAFTHCRCFISKVILQITMQCCLAALMVLGFRLSLWTFEFFFIILFSIWFLVCLLLVDTCLGILSLKFFGSLNILLQNIWFSLFLFFLSLSLLVSTCLSMSLCLVTSCFILLTSWLISVVFHFASPILLMWLVSAFSLFCPTHVAFAWLASDLSESFVSLFLFCYSDCLLICFCMFSLLVFSMLVLCLLGSVFFPEVSASVEMIFLFVKYICSSAHGSTFSLIP